MKAFLLAAGHGTRLRPITNTIPKCLVPINGIPMMTYWFDLFRKYGIDEVLINLNHLPEKVKHFVKKNAKDIKVTLVYEDVLMGSLGTLIRNNSFVKDEKEFFVFYADNLTNVNLEKMLTSHKISEMPFTMGLFHTNDPKSCGIAELSENNVIVDFVEKPKKPKSNLANAGIYIMDPKLLNEFGFSRNGILDIGFDLLPKLIGKMNGYLISEFLLDIGTHKNYEIANQIVKKDNSLFSYVSGC